MALTAEDIRRLFPSGVQVAVCDAPAADIQPLLPAEAAALSARAVDRRRLDFQRGRAAARAALARLSAPTGPILQAPKGQPIWPEGVVGSISHTGGLAAAAVARRITAAGLGLDIEARHAASDDVTGLVLLPSEQAWVEADDASTRRTMVFSAKEAIFKATYPLTALWLDFLDAELAWQPSQRLFRAIVPKLGCTLEVGCEPVHDYVVSAVALPPPWMASPRSLTS